MLKGSSQAQAGPSSALTSARPTQPKTHSSSDATSASLSPPAIVCATTHAQATSPSSRSDQRSGRHSVRMRPGSGSGSGASSLMATNTNDIATAAAAPRM